MVLFKLIILPFVLYGPRGAGWLSVHVILTKSYFYIAFYKMEWSKYVIL